MVCCVCIHMHPLLRPKMTTELCHGKPIDVCLIQKAGTIFNCIPKASPTYIQLLVKIQSPASKPRYTWQTEMIVHTGILSHVYRSSLT